MQANKHKDYKIEKEKLNEVIESMEDELMILNDRNYSSMSPEIAQITMVQDAQKIQDLNRNINSPYFGRIDFKESGSDKVKKLYIGKMSVIDLYKDDSMLVVDWRCPIASLYYESGTKDVVYNAPEGQIKGDIEIRRNFKIKNRNLEQIVDLSINTIDDMLNEALLENKETKLKDIVATIQEEQNQIIREDATKNIIVQGVAGSGKTTIALHRIAYLMYLLSKTTVPKNFMIIAPNKLFLNYISDVLPDLGVDNTYQTTLEELGVILSKEKRHKIEFTDKTGENLFSEEKDINRYKISKLKTSMTFKSIIDNYYEEIKNSLLKNFNFIFYEITIMTKERLEYLLNSYDNIPLNRKINIIHEHCKKSFNENLEKIKINISKSVKEFILKNPSCDKKKIYAEENKKIKNLQKEFNNELNKYITPIKETPYILYKNLVGNIEILTKHAKQLTDIKEYEHIIELSKEDNLEDIPAIMYLSLLIYDNEFNQNIQYVMIDEAQDFGTFQFYVLRRIFKNAYFNIYGDLAQGINEYRGTTSWKEINKLVFDDKAEIKNIVQSYRTTFEIMNYANNTISKLENKEIKIAKPILRHGLNVEEIKINSKLEIAKDIIKVLSDDNYHSTYKSTAIVCKNKEMCNYYYEKLKNDFEIQLLKSKEQKYDSKIVIVPIYLVKGLEFDSIIVPEVTNENYKNTELNIKLLYVAYTRALHRLRVYK